jgi:dolichyl-diphosphooligosaccharide--protein glycosyltransferase
MLALSAIALGAFALQVAISYRSVFGQDFVAFVESDAWYHMRLVDGLIRHFPWRIWHDAYLLHPGGEPVNVGPMLDWIIAGIALVLGVGSPSPRLVDAVGAFVPPVLGALTVVPVYALAKDLFSTRAGLWAAFCAAVLPGALLTRSALGFTDHHCAEVLFTTLTLMCVVRAIDHTRSAKSRSHQAIAAGVSLGTYLLTWGGGALFVATLALWAGLELVVARLRDDNDSSIVHAAVPIFVLSALMVAPWAATRPFFAYDLLALAGGLATIVTLYGIGYWTTGRPRGGAELQSPASRRAAAHRQQRSPEFLRTPGSVTRLRARLSLYRSTRAAWGAGGPTGSAGVRIPPTGPTTGAPRDGRVIVCRSAMQRHPAPDGVAVPLARPGLSLLLERLAPAVEFKHGVDRKSLVSRDQGATRSREATVGSLALGFDREARSGGYQARSPLVLSRQTFQPREIRHSTRSS